MAKKLWIIANWKSNKTLAEAIEWIDEVGPQLEKRDHIKVVVCPPFTDMEEVKKRIMVSNFPMMVGAQDLSPFDEGAYTGEEAARILTDIVDLAILGHSERRQNFGETDQMVWEKAEQAKKHNIIPLVCVQGVDTPVPEGINLAAYEPVFAIGSGHPDTADNAGKVAEGLKEKYGENLQVLYGGSVTSENAKPFLQGQNLQGLLVGGASLDAEEFLKIVQVAYLI